MNLESIINPNEGQDVSKTIIEELKMDFPRYRRSYILDYDGVIRDMEQEDKRDHNHTLKGYENRLFLYVHTRQGYVGEEGFGYDELGLFNDTVRANENYLTDYQDEFDDTYRNFVFKIPEELVIKYKLAEIEMEETFHLTPAKIEAFVDLIVEENKENL
jgi:hypothetical protein